MKIIISGKQLKVTDAIRNYTEEKIQKISKYTEAITDWLVYASGTKIKVETENSDLYAAIDELSDKLERQVRKYKEKQKDFNKKGTR